MKPQTVNQHRGDTWHPENRIRITNCFIRTLDANMGSFTVNQHKSDTCHPENRVRKTIVSFVFWTPTWGRTL
eukprot:1340430-Pyramimonas_sp.AAC.1